MNFEEFKAACTKCKYANCLFDEEPCCACDKDFKETGRRTKFIYDVSSEDECKTECTSEKRKQILEKAIQCVCSDRNQQYGSPENSFADIAKFWSVYLDQEVTPHDVGVMMALFKISRIKTGTGKEDSYVDCAGYIACAAELCDEVEE